jgi:hypothetical protein
MSREILRPFPAERETQTRQQVHMARLGVDHAVPEVSEEPD